MGMKAVTEPGLNQRLRRELLSFSTDYGHLYVRGKFQDPDEGAFAFFSFCAILISTKSSEEEKMRSPFIFQKKKTSKAGRG